MDVSTNEDDEISLVDSAVNGDTGAFTQLFNRYYAMIYAFTYRLSLCASDAQDITQETFIKAARSIGSFRRESSFKNWLYRIATNVNRDWQRHRQRQTRLDDELTAIANETERPADDRAVVEALGALPDEMRQAIVLVYYEEMNHAEAAKIIGCAESTVSWRIFRAKRKLKQLLSQEGDA